VIDDDLPKNEAVTDELSGFLQEELSTSEEFSALENQRNMNMDQVTENNDLIKDYTNCADRVKRKIR